MLGLGEGCGMRGWLQHGREDPGGGPEVVGSAARSEQTRLLD